ncbi:putative uncharacterized protein [Clostridium sp. CAG:356]|nr:putative uncharacterized protein [Clostridium sp. CAG:356]
MRQLPKGISNYEDIVAENRVYVDKTMYIEKMEDLADKTIMFLRPRKFGKTLFTSTLECYYDKNKADKFEELFGKTYIGKNPTPNKNRYCVLRFNFSGISTNTVEETIKGFREKVDIGINRFVTNYKLDFYNNPEMSTEGILGSTFEAFREQRRNEKIYVIIDEYDHFANELLGFKTDEFKELVAKNGKVRKWYEILKEGTESVVDRIFITGVAPITLDSTTSGFNIARDITKNIRFNDMLGFSTEDVKYLMTEIDIPEEKQEELIPIIKENYDGYIFSNMIKSEYENYKIYNSNMTLYFLDAYQEQGQVPEELVDINILSDYGKIEAFMNLCQNMNKIELLEKIVAEEPVESELTEKFNAEISFGEKELVSLLFYLGYLTIEQNELGMSKFVTPNEVVRTIYSQYFLEYIKRKAGIQGKMKNGEMIKEILYEGKIDKAIETLGTFLTNLSNRDYQRFDEKYIKVIFYSICRMLGAVYVKSELEIGGEYADILIIPREKLNERYGVLLEFKYIKQEEYNKKPELLQQKQTEAKAQLERYNKTEEIQAIPNLRSYAIVVVKDKIQVEEL